MSEAKILYIDDDVNMLNTGEDILMGAGYEVSLAKSGEQALKLLAKNTGFDLILLDVDMPGMDGYETYGKIRKMTGCEEIPIIFLTGMNAPDFEIKGLEMGAADYIVKPFVKIVLLARIKRELEKNRKAKTSANMYNPEGLAKAEKELTPSELLIAKLVAEGYSNQEIADKANYSCGYIKKKVSEILDKLYLKNRAEIRALLKKEK